jgi:hypothetical protein
MKRSDPHDTSEYSQRDPVESMLGAHMSSACIVQSRHSRNVIQRQKKNG